MSDAGTKRCPHCKEVKQLSEFGKDSLAKDSHKSWCKACNNANSAAWRKEHSKEIAVYGRAYRYNQRYGDNRLLTLAKDAHYNSLAAAKRWYKKHPGEEMSMPEQTPEEFKQWLSEI
jgi:hypothetical protein